MAGRWRTTSCQWCIVKDKIIGPKTTPVRIGRRALKFHRDRIIYAYGRTFQLIGCHVLCPRLWRENEFIDFASFAFGQ